MKPALAFVALVSSTAALMSISWSIFRKNYWPGPSRLLASPLARAACAVRLSSISLRLISPYFSAAGSTVSEPFQIVFGTNSRELRGRDIDHLELLRVNEQEEGQRKNMYRNNGPIFRPNVVLIIVAGFRPDHLSVLGYERLTTPSLPKIAAQTKDTLIVAGHSGCAEPSRGILSILASRYYSELPCRPVTIGAI